MTGTEESDRGLAKSCERGDKDLVLRVRQLLTDRQDDLYVLQTFETLSHYQGR